MKRKYKEYFNYYLELENDFFSTEPYVTIEEDNYRTYSIQYTKIYLSICSEIDCLLKEICKNIDATTKANKINLYYPIITNEFENFKQEGVYFQKQKIELYPWEEWQESSAPKWWVYYNKIKHQRLEQDSKSDITYYKFSNLENVLNALAALYVVEQYYLYSYDYLAEAEIPPELTDSFITLEEIADDEKHFAMREFTSQRCCMKRWVDNKCYISTSVKPYVDLEGLKYIVHYSKFL